MTLHLRFPDDGWERLARDWSAWWAGELERPLVVLECSEQEDRPKPHFASTFLGNFPTMPADDLLSLFEPRLAATHYLGDSFPRFWPNFGPGIIAAFAGAELHPTAVTTWFTPASTGPAAGYHVRMDWHNRWWQRVQEITAAASERWGQQLVVGFTDLGGNLDILAHLRGTQQLMIDLVKTPGEVDRLVAETTAAAWLDCYERLYRLLVPAGRGITCWAPLWSPGRGYMLQSDISYNISPQMFARFVLPDLESCCAALDYAFYHLDGRGQLGHVDLLLSLPRLRGIQWVPGYGQPTPENWLPLLRRIRASGKLCQVTVSPAGALTIIRELGGKGFCFVIDEPPLTPAEGAAFLKQLEREWYDRV